MTFDDLPKLATLLHSKGLDLLVKFECDRSLSDFAVSAWNSVTDKYTPWYGVTDWTAEDMCENLATTEPL